jgi:hypothetical protein
MIKRRLTATVCTAALALAVSTPLTGCYGSFGLTKKIYKWNGSLGNKFLNTVVMWAFLIIPVYQLASLGDLIIFNLIEFWTGSNPVADANGVKPEVTRLADGSLEIRRGDAVFVLRVLAEDRFELQAGDRVVGEGRVTPEGDLVMTVEGRSDALRIPRAELEAFAARLPADVVAVR